MSKSTQKMKFDALQAVGLLNNAAGNVALEIDENPEIYWATVKKQADLIQLELNEVLEAHEERDLEKLRDATCDVQVTTLGLFHRADINYSEDMDAVITALYSRFCNTELDAKLTVEKYAKLEVETHYKRDEVTEVYVVFSSKDQTGNDGEFYPEGKWLKAHNFKQPVFK